MSCGCAAPLRILTITNAIELAQWGQVRNYSLIVPEYESDSITIVVAFITTYIVAKGRLSDAELVFRCENGSIFLSLKRGVLKMGLGFLSAFRPQRGVLGNLFELIQPRELQCFDLDFNGVVNECLFPIPLITMIACDYLLTFDYSFEFDLLNYVAASGEEFRFQLPEADDPPLSFVLLKVYKYYGYEFYIRNHAYNKVTALNVPFAMDMVGEILQYHGHHLLSIGVYDSQVSNFLDSLHILMDRYPAITFHVFPTQPLTKEEVSSLTHPRIVIERI